MKSTAILAALVTGVVAMPAIAGITVDKTKKNDAVICGVSPGTDGYSAPDSTGKYVGFDVDICRAIAAAILGNADQQL